ncbi:hypothetical protein [Deinococcus sonorensis]|uniref:Tetratricopeptide repeat protein n=2 Tax=Deinococcus sonorensis TaxID=309891 RepID=A0AAU7U939_9DEIO
MIRALRRALLLGLLMVIQLAAAQAALDDRTLSFTADTGRVTWSRSYPAALGPISGPLRQDGLTWLAVGPSLYAYTDSGEQRLRLDLPDVVSALDAGGGVFRVTVGLGSVRDTFTVSDMAVQERVVLPPVPDVTGWLARAAAVIPQAQLSAAAAQDPVNPFLQLRLARLARQRGDQFGALEAVQRAVSAQVPFAASVQLAAALDAAGFPSAADIALDRARRDWAERGYDPDLPVSHAALRAYGNPLGYLNVLLRQNRLRRADVWIRYLREVSPRFEGYPEVYARYAAVLDAQGRSGEADEWRQFSRSLAGGTLYNLGPDALLRLRDAAKLATLGLAVALLAALLGYTAHYWSVQGRDLAPLGGRYGSWLRHPLSRARRLTLSYAGFGERLVLATLVAALLVTLSSLAWTQRVNARILAPALNAGTYGGAWFYDQLEQLGPAGDSRSIGLIRGLAAQLDGDASVARQLYEAPTPLPCALNNLGVLAAGRDDQPQARELYRRALAADPQLTSAAYNLGLNPAVPEAAFQRQLRGPQPRLCYPDQQTLVQAVDLAPGSSALALLRDPWGALTRLPTGLSRPLQVALAALLMVLGAVSVLWLLVPRLPVGRLAGRPALYRLVALLVPGSAQLDGAWGSVLLLGWAFTVAALGVQRGLVSSRALPGMSAPGLDTVLLAVLAACYLLNTVAFVIAELRWARAQRRAA